MELKISFKNRVFKERYDILQTYPVEEILEKIELIKKANIVFCCGIPSYDRNIILKHYVYNKIKVLQISKISDVMMSGSEEIHMLYLSILKC